MFKVNNKNTGATSQPTSGNFRFVRFITTQATGTKEVHFNGSFGNWTKVITGLPQGPFWAYFCFIISLNDIFMFIFEMQTL